MAQVPVENPKSDQRYVALQDFYDAARQDWVREGQLIKVETEKLQNWIKHKLVVHPSEYQPNPENIEIGRDGQPVERIDPTE